MGQIIFNKGQQVTSWGGSVEHLVRLNARVHKLIYLMEQD